MDHESNYEMAGRKETVLLNKNPCYEVSPKLKTETSSIPENSRQIPSIKHLFMDGCVLFY